MSRSRDFPSPIESLALLRGLGWTADHIASQGVSSDLVHVVLGTDGRRSILVMARTEREAWHRALQGAHASAGARGPAPLQAPAPPPAATPGRPTSSA